MGLMIKQGHLDAARAANACDEAMKRYRAGQSISDVDQSDLCWFHVACPDIAADLEQRAGLPLFALAGSGYGYGHAYGSGSWYGYGHGSGSGYGHGHVYGDGAGYGHGYGDGSGSGSGYGDGEDHD